MRASDKCSFLHDADAGQDERLMELKAIHGHWGYGVFWALVERMRAASQYRLDTRLLNGLALSLNEPATDVQRMLQTSEGLGIFAREDEHFIFSPSLRRRMDAYDSKRSRCSDAGKKSAEKRKESNASSTDAEPTLNGCSTDVERESNDCSTYITKDNTTKDNTTEPKGSVEVLDLSTSLVGTDLGNNPVPDLKLVPRKVRTKQPPAELEPLPPHINTPAVGVAVAQWMAYKRERREAYKPIGMRAFHRSLCEMTPERIVAAVGFSIRQGYRGLIEPRKGPQAKQSNFDKLAEFHRKEAQEAENG